LFRRTEIDRQALDEDRSVRFPKKLEAKPSQHIVRHSIAPATGKRKGVADGRANMPLHLALE
jgi:hypothetical protein